MNIVNRIKLKSYPELQKMNFDEETLIKIISNKNFKEQYQKVILPFISKYKDNDMIRGIFELSISNDSEKFANFVDNNYLFNEEKFNLNNNQQNANNDNEKENHVESIWGYFEEVKREKNNYSIIKDKNFDKLFSILKFDVFDESMSKILNKIDSDKLLQIDIGNKNILEYVSNLDRLRWIETIISNDLIDGLKYTYDNVPEFKSEMNYTSRILPEACKQFSKDFIASVGKECLNKMYEKDIFRDKSKSEKVFGIFSKENYELLYDLFDDRCIIDFSEITENNYNKNFLEINKDANVKDYYMKKYMFPTSYSKEHMIFIEKLMKLKSIPDDFQNKYGNIIEQYKEIINLSNDELIELSKQQNIGKDREEYINNIKEKFSNMIEEGNSLLKKQIVNDLKERSNQIVNNSKKTSVISSSGKNLDVYELTGEPFTMMIHAISSTKKDSFINNGAIGKKVYDNPECWNKIEGGNPNISTSVISDKHIKFFSNGSTTVIYWFDSFPSDNLLDMKELDAATPMHSNYNTANANIVLLDDYNNSMVRRTGVTGYGEIILSRKDKAGNKFNPNYIVCTDEINEATKRAAEYFNVPIYLIHTDCYKNVAFNERSNKEKEIASQISEKNKAIAKQKSLTEQLENNNIDSLSKGYISIIIMSLIVIVITILIIMYLR